MKQLTLKGSIATFAFFFALPLATNAQVPNIIEAEGFDSGGEGVGYHDRTIDNQGDCNYRTTEDVDIFVSDDPVGGQCIIKNFETGEWLDFTINVPEDADYDIELRVSTNFDYPDSSFHIEVDHVNVTGSVVLPDTGGWTNYQWLGKQTISLSAGTHEIRLVSNQQYFNINQIRMSKVEPLFSSGYESSTTLEPVDSGDCWDEGCWQDMSGTDASTGYSWPARVWGGDGRLQMIADAPISESTGASNSIDDYMYNEIRTVTGHDGTSTDVLYSEIKKSGCCGTSPQNDGDSQNNQQLLPENEEGDMYISYWLRLQPDMGELMNLDLVGDDCYDALGQQRDCWHWRAVFTWKTSGDYRVNALIKRDPYINNGDPYWEVSGDNNANCSLFHEDGPCPSGLQNFWTKQNMDVSVPIGEWFKVEVFWHRSAGQDGRVWMAVDGQKIVDRYGPNVGEFSYPINRVIVSSVYTSTGYPAYQWVDDLVVRDRMPPQ